MKNIVMLCALFSIGMAVGFLARTTSRQVKREWRQKCVTSGRTETKTFLRCNDGTHVLCGQDGTCRKLLKPNDSESF